MSYRHEGEPEHADAKRSSPTVVRLLGQMMLLPFTVFVCGIELFTKTIRRMQWTVDQGMDLMAGEADQPAAGVTGAQNQFTNVEEMRSSRGDLEDQTTNTTNHANVGDVNKATN